MATINDNTGVLSIVPTDLLNTLQAVSVFYGNQHTVNINYGNGGATEKKGDTYNITIPNGSGGLISVNDINGDNNTFLTYDEESALVHEIGHIILGILEIGADDDSGDSELSISVLKFAVDEANSIVKNVPLADYNELFVKSLQKILNISPENYVYDDDDYFKEVEALGAVSLSITDKLNIARNSTSSSYENYYNTQVRNYAVDSGLSNLNQLHRTGYFTHEDTDGNGLEDEWKSYSAIVDGTTVSGNYKNLLWNDKSVDLLGNEYANNLIGAGGHDYLDGGHGTDFIDGNDGNDTLIGGQERDTVQGGADNDFLYGGKKSTDGYSLDDVETDFLYGGSGFDTYYSNQKDIITDSDGSGKIYFDNDLLSGEKTIVKDTNGYMYEDSKYSYVLDNPNGIGKLTILEGTNATGFTGKEIFVNNFDATKDGGYLGIIFTKKELEITVEDSVVLEGGDLEFRVNINQILDKDLVLSVDNYFNGSADSSDITMPSDKTITIKAGEKTATYKVAAVDDEKEEPTENFIFAVTGIDSSNGYEGVDAYKGNDLGTFTIKNAATGTIQDNDEAGTLYVSISAVSGYEGNFDDNNKLSFVVKASRALKGDESATVDLNIYDIGTDSSDYGFLSEDTITFDSANQQFVITLDIFGDETSTCRELKIANNISTCKLHVEQIQHNKEVA